MVELKDQFITSLMPPRLAQQAEAKAFAYALHQQTEKLLAAADEAMLLCDIDHMPDEILDYLGAEWRTPMYGDELPLETKRALVKSTLLFFIQMGTPAAVNRMIQIVAGAGSMMEWQDYGGEPHYFKVWAQPDDGNVNAETRQGVLDAVNSVKRLSSWMEEIKYIIEAEKTAQAFAAGTRLGTHMREELTAKSNAQPPHATAGTFAVSACTGSVLRVSVGIGNKTPLPPTRFAAAAAGAARTGSYTRIIVEANGETPTPPSKTLEVRASAKTEATYTKIEMEVSA